MMGAVPSSGCTKLQGLTKFEMVRGAAEKEGRDLLWIGK